jgi:hypothetical protein
MQAADLSYYMVSTVREIFLAHVYLHMHQLNDSGRVGGAYYDPVKCLVYVLEDTQDTPHFELAKMR